MSAATTERSPLDVKIGVDLSPLVRAMADVGRRLYELADRLRIVAYMQARAGEQARYEHGKAMAALFPDRWEVFCVTTNEGRCRVISRPRGAWS